MGNFFDTNLLCDRCLPLYLEERGDEWESWWDELEAGNSDICKKCCAKLLDWVNDDNQ